MADKPVTREEKYLAYLTGDYKGEIPKPITRKEKYLYELCLKGIGGEISPEEIKNAVNEYLEKNPVKPGATTEQAQQIEQNKTDIGSLKTETGSLKGDLVNFKNKGVTPEMTSFISNRQIIYSQNHDYWENKEPVLKNATSTWTSSGYLYFGDGGDRYLFGAYVEPLTKYKVSQYKESILYLTFPTLVFATDDKLTYGTDGNGTYVNVSITGDRQYAVSEFTTPENCKYVWFVIKGKSFDDIIEQGYTITLQKITNEHPAPTYPIVPDTYIPYKMSEEIKIFESSILPTKSESVIIAWGDSLTMGAGSGFGSEYDTYSYPAVLSKLLKKEVKNYGVGGETIETIMGRQGCYPMIVQPCIIPSNGKVEVHLKSIFSDVSINPLLQVPNFEKGINPCTIGEIEGALSYDASSDKYYFTRSAQGTEVTISRPAIIKTFAMNAYKDKKQTLILWIGQNNSNEFSASNDKLADKIIDSVRSATSYANTDNYIVLTAPINGQITIYNSLHNKLKYAFGNKALDCANYLIDYGMADENIEPTDQDKKDINERRIPSSLRADNVHLNRYGYNVVANLVYKKGIELGYWS